MRRHLPSLLLFSSLAVALGAAACGGDEASPVVPSTGKGKGGGAGSAGKGGAGSAGASGAGAAAGTNGTAGKAGATAGSGGTAGAAGSAGKAGGAGTGGAAGGAGASAGNAGASSGGSAGTSAGSAGSGGATSTVQIAIKPGPQSVTVPLGSKAAAVVYKLFATEAGKPEQDVTNAATWNIDDAKLASIASPGTAQPTGIAGKALVKATYQGITISAGLTVKVTGDVFPAPLDAKAKEAFDAATPDPSAAGAPIVEYPLAGVVLPSNIPAIEPQWAGGGDSTVFRVRLRSGDTLDLAVYTTGREILLPNDVWEAFRSGTQETASELVVEGVGPSKLIHSSAPVALTVAGDGIPNSAVYIWQNSTQTFRVLDIVKGTDVQLPTDAPALASGATCTGCHRISRDGKRFSYTQIGSEFRVGTLAYDQAKNTFASKAEPSGAQLGTYAAFNPIEAATVPAMLLTALDVNTPQQSAGDVTLKMVHPETLAAIDNDFEAARAKLPAAVGKHSMMADWSPDGGSVVFVAYPGDKHYVRLRGDDTVLGSIVEATVKYQQNKFVFGEPHVLVTAPADANPDSGQNNVLPTVSPDGKYVAFTRADGWWSIKTQQSLLNLSGRISIVRRSDGKVFELAAGTNGPTQDWSSTWPQWAPSNGKRYAWLAFGTERPYGHLMTRDNHQCAGLVQGQKQCKQLWIMGIDLAKLANGDADPSLPPFRVPGQALNVQAVSPQWTLPIGKD